MPRTDEQRHLRRSAEARNGAEPAPAPPSKSQVKRDMHALQQLGERLVALDAARFALLARETGMSERLIDAVSAARSITAWGARKRQLQFVGKLMRDVGSRADSPAARVVGARPRRRHRPAARARTLARAPDGRAGCGGGAWRANFPMPIAADCVRSSRARRTNAAGARRHAPTASSSALLKALATPGE